MKKCNFEDCAVFINVEQEYCIAHEIIVLKAKNAKFLEQVNLQNVALDKLSYVALQEQSGLEAKNVKLREALKRIDVWVKAYPLDRFPKPDLQKAYEVLKAAGMTLGAISADNMRHVLDGIKDIVSEALEE